jgi:hypothetical protein
MTHEHHAPILKRQRRNVTQERQPATQEISSGSLNRLFEATNAVQRPTLSTFPPHLPTCLSIQSTHSPLKKPQNHMSNVPQQLLSHNALWQPQPVPTASGSILTTVPATIECAHTETAGPPILSSVLLH